MDAFEDEMDIARFGAQDVVEMEGTGAFVFAAAVGVIPPTTTAETLPQIDRYTHLQQHGLMKLFQGRHLCFRIRNTQK